MVFAVEAVFQLCLVALLGTGRGVLVQTTLAAAILALVSTLSLLVLADFEHRRSIQPSVVTQLFFFSTIVLDVPRIRTAWLLDDNYLAAVVFTVTFALRFPLLWLESEQKWKRTSSPESIPVENRQGVFGQTFFTWLNPLFLQGYQRDLTMDDLFTVDAGLKGETLHARLLEHWNRGEPPLCSRPPLQHVSAD